MKLFYYNTENYFITNTQTYYTTPTGDWGKESYTFNEIYGCKTPTINACVASLSAAKLSEGMNQTYFVKSPGHDADDWKSIANSITVAPTDAHSQDSVK